jgi:hypothetical protein
MVKGVPGASSVTNFGFGIKRGAAVASVTGIAGILLAVEVAVLFKEEQEERLSKRNRAGITRTTNRYGIEQSTSYAGGGCPKAGTPERQY